MHCPRGNATDPIWRVLTSFDGISSWTPLKPQHSNPNPLTNQLWFIDFLTPPTPLIPHRVPYATQKLMLNSCKMVQKQSENVSVANFPSLKQNFIAYLSSKVSSGPDCIFESVYSNSCCSCSFKPEGIKIGQSSHKMYSNNILNFQESTIILNACTKKSGNLLNAPHMYIYIMTLWIKYSLYLSYLPNPSARAG